MRSNRSRGLLAVLGMALTAMLALGAFAASAQASPTLHVMGKTLKEWGINSVQFAAEADTLKIHVQGWNSGFKCDTVSIKGSATASGGEATVNASECLMEGAPRSQCDVQPMQFSVSIGLEKGAEGRIVETLTPPAGEPFLFIEIPNGSETCSWPYGEETWIYLDAGTMGAEMDSEELIKHDLINSEQFFAEVGFGAAEKTHMYFDGPMSQWLTNPNKAKWSVW